MTFQLAIITSKFMSFRVMHVRANWRIISIVDRRGDFIDCELDDDDKIAVEPFVIGKMC